MEVGRTITAVFALCGFATAVIAALIAGQSATDALIRAIIALLICALLGTFAGMIIQRVVDEHNADYERNHPVPEVRPVNSDNSVSSETPKNM